MKDVFGKSLGGGVFGAAAEETKVVSLVKCGTAFSRIQ